MKSSNYSIAYQNDALNSYMVFKLNKEDKLIEYQVKMLKENSAQNFLALHKNQFDNEVFIYYDITSKITLEQFLARRKLSRHEFLTIIKNLIKTLQLGKRYLLQGGAYIMDIKYMYINPSSLEISIAYMPIETSEDTLEDLRNFLIDLIVYKAAFLNSEEGSFVYRLLSLLKNEAFSLEQLDKLVYDIAVENEHRPDDKKNLSESREASSLQSYKAVERKRSNNRIFIFLLIQLFFIALYLLMVNLMFKKNQGFDSYSASGLLLLVLSADYLSLRRMGVLKRRNKEASQALYNAGGADRSLFKKSKLYKEKPIDRKEVQKYKIDSDMETRILADDLTVYPYLEGVSNNQQERIILNKSSFIIGRLKSQADYISSNSAVGKVHAEIIYRDGAYHIEDLNSRNGTYINGERIASNALHIIKNNDKIAFANSEYKFIWRQGISS